MFCLNCSNEDIGLEPINTPASLDIPQIFSDNLIAPIIPQDNPQTREGIALGKRLFFDTILSSDQTKSCASCHNPQLAFTDHLPQSLGVNNTVGLRNSMPLFNLAWNYNERFAWDGKEIEY